jgi:hypothetical protein
VNHAVSEPLEHLGGKEEATSRVELGRHVGPVGQGDAHGRQHRGDDERDAAAEAVLDEAAEEGADAGANGDAGVPEAEPLGGDDEFAFEFGAVVASVFSLILSCPYKGGFDQGWRAVGALELSQ